MKIRLSELKRIIRTSIIETGMSKTTATRSATSPATSSREQIKAMTSKGLDTQDDADELPEHLRDVTAEPEDTFGPVPPTGKEPYVQQDPLARDYSPLPSSGIRR
jgi:hypothetical protein